MPRKAAAEVIASLRWCQASALTAVLLTSSLTLSSCVRGNIQSICVRHTSSEGSTFRRMFGS